jgi:predicted amidohydrolase
MSLDMKIALCQFDQAWEDREANRGRILSLLEPFPRKEAFDWIVFPEMTLSGFSIDPSKTTLAAEDEEFFRSLARERSCAVSYGGILRGRNCLITLDKEGRTLASYAKMHLYAFGGEDKAYEPGDKQETFLLGGMAVTPAVCFDLRFPYLFWNVARMTDLYVVVASWPARRSEHWMSLLKARAIENQAYVVGVNRTGRDPQVEYGGNSMIFDPLGKVVLDCASREGVHVAQADVTKVAVEKTRSRFPFLKERKASIAFRP